MRAAARKLLHKYGRLQSMIAGESVYPMNQPLWQALLNHSEC